MSGTVIGIALNKGYPGTVSATADAIIQNRVADGSIAFGNAVVLTTDNKYKAAGADFTAANFAGIAVREVVQANTFDPQSNSDYLDGQPCDVLTRGQCTVKVGRGTPTAGGTVYVRIAANASYAASKVGDIEAAADSTNTIALTNVEFTTGSVDANGIAEITIKTRNRG